MPILNEKLEDECVMGQTGKSRDWYLVKKNCKAGQKALHPPVMFQNKEGHYYLPTLSPRRRHCNGEWVMRAKFLYVYHGYKSRVEYFKGAVQLVIFIISSAMRSQHRGQ